MEVVVRERGEEEATKEGRLVVGLEKGAHPPTLMGNAIFVITMATRSSIIPCWIRRSRHKRLQAEEEVLATSRMSPQPSAPRAARLRMEAMLEISGILVT